MKKLAVLASLIGVSFMVNDGVSADLNRVAIAIHGGLALPRGKMTSETENDIRGALKNSLTAGFQELKLKNGDSIRAVVAAIKVLEDSPQFNAGKGAVVTSAKTIELDAAIMEGKERRAGCVAAVKRIRNPIFGALAVMQHSPYVLLVGEGADKFAEDHRLLMVEPEYFFTPRRLQEYERLKASRAKRAEGDHANRQGENRGTVGAVALDQYGNVAAGTSTGGLAFKIPGRVGDSAIIGAGTYADNRTCAISATGDGEFFMRSCAAHDIAAKILYRKSTVLEAAEEVIADVRHMGAEGGVIVLDRKGHLAMPYAAEGMYRGFIDQDGEIQINLYDR